MFNIAYSCRQSLSALLAVAMLFSIAVSTAPFNKAYAGIIGSVGSVLKSVFVNVGAVAAGVVGGALGAAVGGGPLGMGIGAIAGFVVGKKALNFITSSAANFATAAGAIAGGCLCAGMGFPMLAVGVIGGGLLARLVTKGVQKLFGKKKPLTITSSDLNNQAAEAQNSAVAEYLAQHNQNHSLQTQPINAPTPTTGIQDSQTAYDNYTKAYQAYAQAMQNGDQAAAQKAYTEYKMNLELYSALLKAGR